MTSTILTIISGVIVFIISQYFLELVLRPHIMLNKKRAKFSEIMLKYHADYLNAGLDKSQIENIHEVSTSLLSSAWQLYFFSKKQRNKYLQISKYINYITSVSIRKPGENFYQKINEYIELIEQSDKKIKITFQSFNNKGKKK